MICSICGLPMRPGGLFNPIQYHIGYGQIWESPGTYCSGIHTVTTAGTTALTAWQAPALPGVPPERSWIEDHLKGSRQPVPPAFYDAFRDRELEP